MARHLSLLSALTFTINNKFFCAASAPQQRTEIKPVDYVKFKKLMMYGKIADIENAANSFNLNKIPQPLVLEMLKIALGHSETKTRAVAKMIARLTCPISKAILQSIITEKTKEAESSLWYNLQYGKRGAIAYSKRKTRACYAAADMILSYPRKRAPRQPVQTTQEKQTAKYGPNAPIDFLDIINSTMMAEEIKKE